MKIVNDTAQRGFNITNKGRILAQVKYENWLSYSASTLFNGKQIDIKAHNIWNSKFDIYKNGVDKGDITFNWKGNMIIQIEGSEKKVKSYLLQAKGFWNQYFELIDAHDNVVFYLKASTDWKNLNYSMEVENISPKYSDDTIAELLIYSTYAVNLYYAMMMG